MYSSKYFDHLVVFTAGIGMFLSTLDSGIINVALPTLSKSFNVTPSFITWSVTLYTLLLTGTIIIFGRLSDKYSRLNIYSLGLTVFLIASILCGFSNSIMQLIVFRGLQGIGAAMLQGTATAIITTTIPEDRQGPALGTLSILLGIGPVLGPSIGGLLISIGNWRWIFWINIPFIFIGLIGSLLLKKYTKEQKSASIHLDMRGNFLLFISVFCLLISLTSWSSHSIFNISVYGNFLLFMIVFCLFIVWELKTNHPIINLHLFKNLSFSAPIFAIFVFGGTTSLGFIIPPYVLEKVNHLSSWQIGLVNLTSPLGLVIISKLTGKLISHIGNIILMTTGLLIMIVSYTNLGLLQYMLNPITISLLLLLYGIGGGFFLPSNTSAIMKTVSQDIQGTVGATQRMVQNIGIAFYTAVTSLFISNSSNSDKLISGASHAWLFASLSLFLALIPFLLRILKKAYK
ncbi:MFS transporter [Staphylococcus epidermidis]|uniref:MFS transporter n=1 Tax=Staphylococcus epidermidis TaxID=1282 RepID=UPI0003553670|nr:MFS transporter [Staphylococcus epidermidis]EPP67812.1 MFS transporter [Staphylococcus epidermidis Scl22]ESR04254.1 MFS transporter [Staphylococcus epidermidis CIM28]ESR27899.1 MFS transporter [Staphylococcus epidermidis APO35]ESU03172.1 MFS transporter [Staphylococcus epidermidis CIM37]ESV10416.1 MFS transporter [Staphylococcus epidermidis MC28]